MQHHVQKMNRYIFSDPRIALTYPRETLLYTHQETCPRTAVHSHKKANATSTIGEPPFSTSGHFLCVRTCLSSMVSHLLASPSPDTRQPPQPGSLELRGLDPCSLHDNAQDSLCLLIQSSLNSWDANNCKPLDLTSLPHSWELRPPLQSNLVSIPLRY